jgi:hypothetical protein
LIALAEAGVKAIFPGDRVRASLKPLVLSAPHLIARLSELLLRFTEFALKAPQLAFEATNFPLDSFDPVNLSVGRISHCRHYGCTDRYRCAAAMPVAARFFAHAPSPPFKAKHTGRSLTDAGIFKELETFPASRL